jgi:3',5'-cyclic AMP phosphodiesterase CpdA
MRVAHCSDLHLLSLDGARLLDYANKRWIGRLNLLASRSRHHHVEAFEDMVRDFATAGIDHVFCTGDVTNLALEQEFAFAKVRFDQITLPTTEVTVIPGNHDSYVAAGLEYFGAIFAPYFTSDPDFGEGWPVVRVRGNVAIIGLSTSLATPWFTAYGRLGEAQLARLDDVLARLAGKTKIIGIHHPPAGSRSASRIRGLKDREAFAAVIAKHGADLILHGHEHRDLAASLPGPDGPIPVLGVPSGTYEAGHPERTARYRVIEIGQQGEIVHHMRVWDRDRKVFGPDEKAC